MDIIKYAIQKKLFGGGGGGGSSAAVKGLIERNLLEISDDSVTYIGRFAFYRSSVRRVSFPNATRIETGAFVLCDGLQSLDLPNVVTVEAGATDEMEMSGFGELYLPKAKTIGDGAFASCQGLGRVELPCVESIGDGAFYMAFNLYEVIIGTPSVCQLGSDAFDEMAIWGGLQIFVPANLVDAYKSATNWSAFADVIMPIEG